MSLLIRFVFEFFAGLSNATIEMLLSWTCCLPILNLLACACSTCIHAKVLAAPNQNLVFDYSFSGGVKPLKLHRTRSSHSDLSRTIWFGLIAVVLPVCFFLFFLLFNFNKTSRGYGQGTLSTAASRKKTIAAEFWSCSRVFISFAFFFLPPKYKSSSSSSSSHFLTLIEMKKKRKAAGF